MSQGSEDDKRLTSKDLFGDIVDAQSTAPDTKQTPVTQTGSQGRIKVKVSEPSVFAKPKPRQEDLSALVDAFDDGGVSGASDPPAEPAPQPEETEPPVGQRRASDRQEGLTELQHLTRGLRAGEVSTPWRSPGEVDLASIAESALVHTPAEPSAADDTMPSRTHEPPIVGYGPYRLIEKIATGGMAEVFKAKRTGVAGFEKIVAVKRILPHLSYNKEFVEMFIDEAKMVAQLQHPNIVQIFDLGRIGTSYYIAMEYVRGADLRSILGRLKERRLRMPLDLALFVVSRVAAGLEHAHQKKDHQERPVKIVHRDVSPQNILISYDGEVKLADFGIAKAATKASTTEKGALRGKLMYMSPEQAWARPIDHRSDIFALGIILYELVTDQRPFLGDTEMSLLEKVRRGVVAQPSTLYPDIPRRVEKLLMKMLEKDPADRPRDIGLVNQELESILQESSQAPTARDLARFARILFDHLGRGEAGEGRSDDAFRTGEPQLGEISLRELDTDVLALEHATADEPLRITNDAMSIERLLKRFG